MMQALLADRFKLKLRTEIRQLPIYAMVLENPGRVGPRLRVSSKPCLAANGPAKPASVSPPTEPSVPCGLTVVPQQDGQLNIKMNGTTLDQMAAFFAVMASGPGGLRFRPTLDSTGLSGSFDFSLLFLPQPKAPQSDSAQTGPGSSFLEALRSQLGIKLEKQTGPVNIYFVDQVQQPSDN